MEGPDYQIQWKLQGEFEGKTGKKRDGEGAKKEKRKKEGRKAGG